MSLDLENLDDDTRAEMLSELARDLREETLYMSKYLSEVGRSRYPDLLKDAIDAGTDASLAAALHDPTLWLTQYERRKPKGGYTLAAVPVTAPQTLAEGEFNRFYLRGVSLRAIATNQRVEVYRARESQNPRSQSTAMIGTKLDPEVLLADLRESLGVDTALGLPPGPNSGLSGRLVP